MKTRAITLAVAALLAGLGAAAQTPSEAPKTVIGPGGFEMTTYYVGFLYRGPKWTAEQTPETEALQKAHLDNIQKMAQAGKLLVAGPFTDGGDLRGLYVFRVATMEEAQALAATDPAVKAGRLRLEFHPWFAAKNIKVTAQAEPPAR
jgi:uncharacterized protein YciI